jgi:hypothetical protein
MKQIKLLLFIIACANIFAQCKKTKIETTELEKLPPATQTGANTFGCLVNGKAWVAQRNDCSIFCPESFKIIYNSSNGGNLSITGLNININEGIDQGILLGIDSTNFKSTFIYNITSAQNMGFTYINNSTYTRSWDSLVTCTGSIKLTSYNLQTGIISGVFDFTLTKPNTTNIIVTDGRFDKKL